MRISDWSSDVCSSDLNFSSFMASSRSVVGLRLRDDFRQRSRMPIGNLVDDLFRTLKPIGLALTGRADEFGQQRSPIVVDHCGRSEEHTSAVTNAHLV